jgi:rhodanese-related sulfurtransferase
MVPVFRTVGLAVTFVGSPLLAQSSAITETARSFSFLMHGNEVTISRRGPSCPSSCVQPIQVAPGVATLGELEVIAFLQSDVSTGSGLLVDVRMPSSFSAGSVPGAVNVPVATFARDNPYRDDLLSALGVTGVGATPNFGSAFSLVIFGDGTDDSDAPEAINSLLDAGYPAGKILYYRGGASDWTQLGLNLSVGQ